MATHCKKPRDDIIKIAPTVEIYNQSMVQKHPVKGLKVTEELTYWYWWPLTNSNNCHIKHRMVIKILEHKCIQQFISIKMGNNILVQDNNWKFNGHFFVVSVGKSRVHSLHLGANYIIMTSWQECIADQTKFPDVG